MNFFDKVKESIIESSQDVSKKAKDTTETMKLQSENREKGKEIEKLLYQIGMQYFASSPEECEKLFPELTGKIKEAQSVIEKNNQVIESINNVPVCSNCGKPLATGAMFCVYCGTKVSCEEVQEQTGEEKGENDNE